MRKAIVGLLVIAALVPAPASAAVDGERVVAIGRFNRDRADDVLLYSPAGLVARDGRNGVVLWEQSAGSGSYEAVQLFGDGRTEIFGWTFSSGSDECDEPSTTTLRVEIRHPGTGRILWRREVVGQRLETAACPIIPLVQTDEPARAELIDDADGDGISDVFVLITRPVGARVFSGVDGREIDSLLVRCGCDEIVAVSDLDGDRRADFLTTSGAPAGRLGSNEQSLVGARSADGSLHWTGVLPAAFVDVIGTARLTAGPGRDLIVRTWRNESPGRLLYAIDGASGATLWDREIPYQVTFAGDIDRDGFKDVLAVTALEKTPGGQESVSAIEALSGSTGQQIWRRTFGRQPNNGADEWTEQCCLEARLGRDRVRDWILLGAYYVEDRPPRNNPEIRYTAIDGRTGVIMWRTRPARRGARGVLVGDLDGRRGQDFIRLHVTESGGGCTISARAISGFDRTFLWRVAVERPKDRCRPQVDSTADLDGDGEDEIIVAVFRDGFDQFGARFALDRDGIMWG